MADKQAVHVSLVVTPGTLAMPISGLYEVLTAFPVVSAFYDEVPATPPFDVDIVGPVKKTMTTVSGLPITIQRALDEIEYTDIVIVPTMDVDVSFHSAGHPELVAWMKRMHEAGAMLCSACTGLFVLAETGLLDGHRATTHWAFEQRCQERFPKVELCLGEVLVTAGEDEELVMAGGSSSWEDLVLYLISRFVSPAASQAIAKFEIMERHADGQAPYLPFLPRTHHGDSVVLGLQDWLKTHFGIASPVAEMTTRAGMSQRSFERRFRKATGYTPINYVQRVRIEAAKRQLEVTDTTIEDISWEVGYEDAAAFRRLFKRIAQVTPSEYRRKFSTHLSRIPATLSTP